MGGVLVGCHFDDTINTLSFFFFSLNIVSVSHPVCFPGAKAPQWNYLRGESVNQENSGNMKSQSQNTADQTMSY